MAGWCFWIAGALILYTYGGYLLVLILLDAFDNLRGNVRHLAGVDRRTNDVDRPLPRVSVLIAAHNEESCLRSKIESTLAFDYPAERLEILIGSDGSTDATDAIVRKFSPRVQLSAAPRAGKASVLNRLVRLATGDVFLLTDANTVIEPGALRRLVRRLADERVGVVSGRLRLIAANEAATEGLYWRYETLLKLYESKRGALMGANGGLYIVRREDWQSLPPDTIVDDFLVTMRVIARGRRAVYDSDAVATEPTAPDLAGELRRHVRIAAGNFQSLRELRPLLFRPSFAAFAFWSHKLLRWCVPFLMGVVLISNLFLIGHGFIYALALLGQSALFAAALVPPGSVSGPFDRFCALARYFVGINGALVLGFVRSLTGRQSATWQRTKRPLPALPRAPSPEEGGGYEKLQSEITPQKHESPLPLQGRGRAAARGEVSLRAHLVIRRCTMADKLTPRTAIDRGPAGEEFIGLDQNQPEVVSEAGGDTLANELDANVGGASATAGMDSGGTVGVRRGLAVGRPGAEYENAPSGETSMDIAASDEESIEENTGEGVSMDWPDIPDDLEKADREAHARIAETPRP